MKTTKGPETATLVIATAGGGSTELLDAQVVNASLESVDTLNRFMSLYYSATEIS